MHRFCRRYLSMLLVAGLLAGSAAGGPARPSYAQPDEDRLTAAVAVQSDDATSERAEPIMLASGQFGEVDGIHKGTGSAVVWQLPDGARFLRFEEFRVTNGPDLYVYLSGHPSPRDSHQLHERRTYEVALLKGNVGSQNYELPGDLDLAGFSSVVIYCKRFSTVFSTAELVSAS